MNELSPELVFSLMQRAFLILGSIFYAIFAMIVTKQIATLSKGVTDKFNSVLITFSYIHLLLSVLLIILVLLGL